MSGSRAVRRKNREAPANPPGEILNLQEAADFLGVSSKTFQKVLRSGDVPGRKVGREWKFSRQALLDWIGSGRSSQFMDGSDAGDGTAQEG